MSKKIALLTVVSLVLVGAYLAPGVFAAVTSTGNVLYVHESGYKGTTIGCIEATANTYGDGGTLSPTLNGRYTLNVNDNSGVRIANGVPCVAYTGGPGRIVNANSLLDWTAQPTADGGSPVYSLCAQTAGTIVQLCPL